MLIGWPICHDSADLMILGSTDLQIHGFRVLDPVDPWIHGVHLLLHMLLHRVDAHAMYVWYMGIYLHHAYVQTCVNTC